MEYRCRLSLTHEKSTRGLLSRFGKTELTLLDIPGERLADLSMARTRYADWSDTMLKLFEDDPDYEEPSSEFRQLLDNREPLVWTRIVREYKRALARMIFQRLPVISPSTMLLTREGQYVPAEVRNSRSADALAEKHVAGIASDAEFAPLSATARLANPNVAKQFEQNYTRYRKELVNPLARQLYSCDQLVVLVDIATLLAGGPEVFNGCQRVLQTMLQYLVPGRSMLTAAMDRTIRAMSGGRRRLGGRFQLSSLRRLAIVASQADRVHLDDRVKLEGLASQLLGPIEDSLDSRRVTTQFFHCSAVNSSKSLDYPNIEVVTEGTTEPRRTTVGQVPDLWPDDWNAGDFHFPHFAPIPPALLMRPPTQSGLDRIASFMLELS